MNESRLFQLFQVKGQGRARQLKLFTDRPGGETGWAGSNQQTKNVQPGFLRQSRQSGESLMLFHYSINIEMLSSSSGGLPARGASPMMKSGCAIRSRAFPTCFRFWMVFAFGWRG